MKDQIAHVQKLIEKWNLPIDYDNSEISSSNIAGNFRIWLSKDNEEAGFLILGTGDIAMAFEGDIKSDRPWISESKLPFDMDDARAQVKSLSLDAKTQVSEHQPYTPDPNTIHVVYVEPNRKMTSLVVERETGKLRSICEDIAAERPQKQ